MYAEHPPTVNNIVINNVIMRFGAEGFTGTDAMLKTVNDGVRS